jgi:hypothetical protein
MAKANIVTVTPTHDDWVRLAAFIDGEGYIGIISTKGTGMKSVRYLLKLEVANTDIRLGVWCKERFGGCLSMQKTRKNRPNEKPCYHWITASQIAANLLRQCLPYFIIKRHEAEIAIEFQKTFKRGNFISEETKRQRSEMHTNLLSIGGHGKFRSKSAA